MARPSKAAPKTTTTDPEKRFKDLQVEYLPPADLIPYSGNAKQHPDAQVEQIAASMHRFGFTAPILIDEEGMILAGHGRLLAARKLKMDQVPCVRKLGLTRAEKQAYVIADNRLTTNTDYDMEILENELRQIIDSEEFEDLNLIGYTDDELDELFKDDTAPPLPADDEMPTVDAEIFSKAGDIFDIGPHRLVVFDCTHADNLKTNILDHYGKQFDLVFIDPPYAIYGSSTGLQGDIVDDKMVRPFFRSIFQQIQLALKPFSHVYICCDWRSWASWWEEAKNTRIVAKNMIVWDKASGLGTMYNQAHELLMFAVLQPAKEKMTDKKAGQRLVKKPNVWHISRTSHQEKLHNAQKPIELVVRAVENSTDKGNLVLDLFGGSGTTMVACEHTGRVNASMEIEPKYADLIVRRMATLYPELAIMRNGEPFTPPIAKVEE